MDDALETCDREGMVAFGSQLQEMFYAPNAPESHRQRLPSGTRVLICVSRSGDEGEAFRKYLKEITGNCATYEATYVQWQCANASGKHPDPRHRPASTQKTDTAFMGFWEVSDLRKLDTPITLGELFGSDTKTK
jgi:hypothetical protein